MFKINKITDSNELLELKTQHLNTLSAPLDAYWEEALIGFSDHHEIIIEDARVGYFCLNSENQLVAFYLNQPYANHGGDVLSFILKKYHIKAALAGTNDPYFLSLCLDIASNNHVHTLLFQDIENVESNTTSFENYSFKLATMEDFSDIFMHYCAASGSFDTESVETGFEDIKGYIKSVLNEHHIFTLREEGQLLATSECRISKTQQPYADVGMIVAESHRRKGLGSYILQLTKVFCIEQNTKPICSCEAGNIGSQKAIINAGFISNHRIVQFGFNQE